MSAKMRSGQTGGLDPARDEDIKTDVSVVDRPGRSALVAFHLEDAKGSLSCMLTQEQAEALSKALVAAADKARFVDAGKPTGRLQTSGR